MLKEYFDIGTYLGNDYTLGTVLVYACICTLFLPVYLTVAALVPLLIWILLHRQTRSAILKLPGAWFLLAFCAFSIVIPAVYGNQIGILTGFILTMMTIVGMSFRVILKKWQYERALSLICAGSVFGFFTAVVQQIANLSHRSYRPPSVTVNPNFYAAMAALAALICVYKIACKSSYRLVYASLLLMNLLGMDLAECRSAIAAFLFALVIFFIFNRQRKLLILSLCLAAAFAVAVLAFPELLERFQTFGRDWNVRQKLWEAGISGFLRAPVFGKGSFSFLFENIPSGVGFYPHSHNLVIEFLLNYGVVGAVLFGIYYVKLLRGVYGGGALDRRQHFALICSVCAYSLAHGMFDCTPIWPCVLLMTVFVFSVPGKSNRNAVKPANTAQEPAAASSN